MHMKKMALASEELLFKLARSYRNGVHLSQVLSFPMQGVVSRGVVIMSRGVSPCT